MNKKTFYWALLLVLSVLLAGLSGCSRGADQPLTFSQLISQAEKYNGKNVTIEAFYFSGFEIQSLSENVGTASSGPWRLVPTGALIWVEGGITPELQNRLYGQTTPPSGYTEHIGKLKVSGLFQSGGKYGHLDGFEYQIKITRADILEWTPP
jgi:hypothetical protein